MIYVICDNRDYRLFCDQFHLRLGFVRPVLHMDQLRGLRSALVFTYGPLLTVDRAILAYVEQTAQLFPKTFRVFQVERES